MKTRTALFVAALLLLTVSAFADDPARSTGAAFRAHDGKAVALDPADRASRTLKVPYIFDGVEFPAEAPLPDVGLTFVLTHEDIQKGTIHVFSSHDVAKAFMKKNNPRVATDGVGDREVVTNSCSWTNGYSRFEKSRGCGDSTYLTMWPPSDYYEELDSISWNNSISCVYAACATEYTVLYSCRYFIMITSPGCDDPDRLYIAPGDIITDLTYYGFNNRTSSMKFE